VDLTLLHNSVGAVLTSEGPEWPPLAISAVLSGCTVSILQTPETRLLARSFNRGDEYRIHARTATVDLGAVAEG